MHDPQTFETRLSVALGRYVDQVSTDVDSSALVRATRHATVQTVMVWRPVLPMRLAIILGLLVALGGGALYLGAGQGPSPVPTTISSATPTIAPTAIADEFLWPFEYTLPVGSNLALTTAATQMYAFTEGSSEPYPNEGARQVRGITVNLGMPARTHGEGRGDHVALRSEAFLTDLRGNPTLSVGPITPTVLGGLPARQADVEGNNEVPGYPHIQMDHSGMDEDGHFVELGFPGRLIVANVDGASLLVHIWAGTDEELAVWLPMATEFVDSIRFMQRPSPSFAQDPSPMESAVAPFIHDYWIGARGGPAGLYSWMVGEGRWMHKGMEGSDPVEITFDILGETYAIPVEDIGEAGVDLGRPYSEVPERVADTRIQAWVLDVDGTRVVVIIESFPNTAAALVAEAEAIVDSIYVEPAGTGPGRRLVLTLPDGWDSG